MRKLLLLSFLLALCAIPAHAQFTCTRSGSTLTPKTAGVASLDAGAVQACFNLTLQCGDVITLGSGSATWSTIVQSGTMPSGCSAGQGVTLQGQTTCTGSGDPFQASPLSCTDNTNITLSSANTTLIFGSCTSTEFNRITGITFTDTNGASNGKIAMQGGSFGQPCARFDHNHGKKTTGGSGAFLKMASQYGLIDHNLIDEGVCGTQFAPPFYVAGVGSDIGYTNWNAANQLGTNQAIVIEQNTYNATAGCNSATASTEGMFDSYQGARVMLRFNTINNTAHTGGHGTDSGPYRSTMLQDIYGNLFANNTGQPQAVYVMRGGMFFYFGNIHNGPNSFASSILLQYFRNRTEQTAVGANFGFIGTGLNWIPNSLTTTAAGSGPCVTTVEYACQTLNAANWVTSHAYSGCPSSCAVVSPTSGNAGGFNFQITANCTSGGSPTWTQTWGGTSSDGGCTWTNVGGVQGPSPLTTHGWCAANPDTFASSDAVCNALSPGDTASRYFDPNGGVYPYRDMPCVGHNQTSIPCLEFANTGNQTVPLFSGVTATANRDYFTPNATCTGTVTTGVCSGTLAAAPNCNPNNQGPFYWATDQGSWNSSGNTFGQGVVYRCSAHNTWSVYYTPYIYPYTGGNVSITPSPKDFGSITVGASSAPVTFTITNGTSNTVGSISPSLTGGNVGDFSTTNTGAGSCSAAGGTLAIGASCTITATFSPTAVGARTTTLRVTYSGGDGASPLNDTLSGTGTGTPIVSLSPSSITFPNTAIAATSAPYLVTLTNTGPVSMTITSIAITGVGFSETTTCGGTLASLASCTVSVQFTPTAFLTFNASLVFTTNAPSSPDSVPLSGVAIAVAPTPASIGMD